MRQGDEDKEQNHNNFLSKRSMILDKDFYPLSRKQSYTPSMIPRCLNQLSSSDSFITRQFQACSSNALCQFTNLLLFYRLCSQISKVSNLYNVKEEEVEEELKNWGVDATDMDKLDVNNTLDKAVLSLKAQKRKPRGELKTVECQKDEYDFIKELLYPVSFKQTQHLFSTTASFKSPTSTYTSLRVHAITVTMSSSSVRYTLTEEPFTLPINRHCLSYDSTLPRTGFTSGDSVFRFSTTYWNCTTSSTLGM